MPISKRRKVKKRKKREHGPFFVRHPLSHIPHDSLVQGLTEIGLKHIDSFPALLAATIKNIQSAEPLQILASLAAYGLMGTISDSGETKSYKGDRFNQSHVELVQALVLQMHPDDISAAPPQASLIQELFDGLPDLGDAFSYRRMVNLAADHTAQEKAVLMLQEHLRLHTQVVRNWGFFDKVVRITTDLCQPIDSVFVDAVGLPGSTILGLFAHLVRRKEQMLSNRWTQLRPVFNERTPEGMARQYYEQNPQFREPPEALLAFIAENNLDTDQVKALLLYHADLSLADALTFSAATLASELNLQEAQVLSLLNRLSISFGELAEKDAEHFFLDNPVWVRPIINLGEGLYFCALPQGLFSFVFPIIESLLSQVPGHLSTYQQRRAHFLEGQIRSLFEQAFPGCEIASGYKWKDGQNKYENDLLVRIDSHLILVEAKSGSISWPALRGAPQRARRHVVDLFLEPSFQSFRLERKVLGVIESPSSDPGFADSFPVDLKNIRSVLRLSVTLEDFAVLQSNIQFVKEAGWTDDATHPLAPCILLADLEIVFDVLELTASKLHYLKRRYEIQANMRYHGDELDLLGLYLQTGFNIGEAEFNNSMFELSFMSKRIDSYYTARAEGIKRSKPHPQLTQFWRDICLRLESRNFHQWSDVGVVVLQFSFDEQEKMERYFKRTKKNVLKNWRIDHHECSIVVIPNKHRSDALSFFAFREAERERRHERMQNIAGRIFDHAHVRRCIIFGVNIDSAQYPYSTLGVFFRGEETSAEATRADS